MTRSIKSSGVTTSPKSCRCCVFGDFDLGSRRAPVHRAMQILSSPRKPDASPRPRSRLQPRPTKVDSLMLPICMPPSPRPQHGASSQPLSGALRPQTATAATHGKREDAASVRSMPQWHQLRFGSGAGFRQNASLFEAAAKAEARAARAEAIAYSPRGIRLAPDGLGFMVRPQPCNDPVKAALEHEQQRKLCGFEPTSLRGGSKAV